MENVPEVVGSTNIKDFQKWRAKLEELGYSNYDMILNAKDYGIPQNRRRCFMVSILGEVAYSFPKELELKYKLGDMLEKRVDKKYYFTPRKIEQISKWKAQQKPLENIKKNVEISPTLTARGAGEEHSGMVLIDTNLFKKYEIVDYDSSEAFRREHGTQESPTLITTPKFAVVIEMEDDENGN